VRSFSGELKGWAPLPLSLLGLHLATPCAVRYRRRIVGRCDLAATSLPGPWSKTPCRRAQLLAVHSGMNSSTLHQRLGALLPAF